MTDKILEYISENKVSTTEIADALGRTGELHSALYSLTPRARAVGRIYYAPCFNNSNYYAHLFIEKAPKKHIIIVEGVNCANRALFGELVAKYIILYKQSPAVIALGMVRDAQSLIKEAYPVWALGTTPIGCENYDTGMDEQYYNERKKFFEGAIAIADDTGVIVITQDRLNEELYAALQEMELKEDIWFDCLDRLKMSTFEIVCQKKYEQFK